MIHIDPEAANDPFYRYKMTPLHTVVRNGCTELSNLEQVAREIDRDPDVLVKFFSQTLGCRAKNKYVLSGTHLVADLQAHLYRFIEELVLCPSCRNPETTFRGGKTSLVLMCRACGNQCVTSGRLKVEVAIKNKLFTH